MLQDASLLLTLLFSPPSVWIHNPLFSSTREFHLNLTSLVTALELSIEVNSEGLE